MVKTEKLRHPGIIFSPQSLPYLYWKILYFIPAGTVVGAAVGGCVAGATVMAKVAGGVIPGVVCPAASVVAAMVTGGAVVAGASCKVVHVPSMHAPVLSLQNVPSSTSPLGMKKFAFCGSWQ